MFPYSHTLKENLLQGIAVISYGDERLAPSRTAIYITIAVILFLALTGTFVVLFYPRTVSNARRLTSFWYMHLRANARALRALYFCSIYSVRRIVWKHVRMLITWKCIIIAPMPRKEGIPRKGEEGWRGPRKGRLAISSAPNLKCNVL